MEFETGEKILQEIDGILTAVGQSDYDKFRRIVETASTLLTNLATWSAKVAAMSHDDLAALIQQQPQSEQERILRLLSGMREWLPNFGVALIKAAQIFPSDPGGRPESFQDRETQRQACRMILKLIVENKSEVEAKRIVAKEFKVKYHTMHRTWLKRQELAEWSFEEFIERFLKSLSVADVSENPPESSESTNLRGVDQQ